MGTQTSQPLFSRARLSSIGSSIGEASEDLLPRFEKLCRERPWTAITLGVALGFLVRGLLSRD